MLTRSEEVTVQAEASWDEERSTSWFASKDGLTGPELTGSIFAMNKFGLGPEESNGDKQFILYAIRHPVKHKR